MMLNDYANKFLPDYIKKELNEKEIEIINSIDLKSGYYFLAKWISIVLSSILLFPSIIFNSKTILVMAIILVSMIFLFNWLESHWMDIQDKYLNDLIIYITLEIKIREGKLNKKGNINE